MKIQNEKEMKIKMDETSTNWIWELEKGVKKEVLGKITAPSYLCS